MAVGAPLRTPLGSLQATAPSRVQTPPPVKNTSLHNRLGVLKCSKTHLQQTRISKISGGGEQTPGPPLLDPPFNTNRAANCLTPALAVCLMNSSRDVGSDELLALRAMVVLADYLLTPLKNCNVLYPGCLLYTSPSPRDS